MTNKKFPDNFIFGTALASYQVKVVFIIMTGLIGRIKKIQFVLNHVTRLVNIMNFIKKT